MNVEVRDLKEVIAKELGCCAIVSSNSVEIRVGAWKQKFTSEQFRKLADFFQLVLHEKTK